MPPFELQQVTHEMCSMAPNPSPPITLANPHILSVSIDPESES